MSELGKLLLLTYEPRSSGAMYISYEEVLTISRACGISFGEVKRYAQILGMYMYGLGGL